MCIRDKWRSGRSRAFDSSADGFVCSEGCVMVFLKRMEDARRDGDRVRAVIRGTATNQDGRTGTITKPSRDAQVLVYRAALRNAGVDPDTVGRVEAHGTGTPVGPHRVLRACRGLRPRRPPLRGRFGEDQFRAPYVRCLISPPLRGCTW
nr:beta-ketoacyl synthase N-terminal-like domain-containing protein [Streptomyces sp. WAC04770]